MSDIPRSQRYGRMFPPTQGPVDLPSEEDLKCLGAGMVDAGRFDHLSTYPDITYFGQFIDHDLTRDITKLEDRLEPCEVVNYRTPTAQS